MFGFGESRRAVGITSNPLPNVCLILSWYARNCVNSHVLVAVNTGRARNHWGLGDSPDCPPVTLF